MSEVVHNAAEQRYEIKMDDGELAIAAYETDPFGNRILVHTLVPDAYRGHGVAGRLARYIFDDARKSGFKLVLICPYMVEWYKRHPEYADVVIG